MKNLLQKASILVLISFSALACSSDSKSDAPKADAPPKEVPWNENHGVGPVKAMNLNPTINQKMADLGKTVFEGKCSACHKPNKRYIGPAVKDILDRRTPAWVMNMILNPENMVANDPIAKKLLMEYNGTPMANQNLTKEEARAVLEYFRTL